MTKKPISFAAPKRFLTARTMRKRLPTSLSKYSTVSTMCSSTRGPASVPSFVTWPISSVATLRDFANRVSCAAHSRTWLTEPGADCSSSLNNVWIESIASTPSLSLRGDAREHGFDAGLGEHVERHGADGEALRA